MNKKLKVLLSLIAILWLAHAVEPVWATTAQTKANTHGFQEKASNQPANKKSTIATNQKPAQVHALKQANVPPIWLALPFLLLLFMIASGPLLYEAFWHKHYPKIAIGLAGFVMAYYIFRLHNWVQPVEALMEYLQFIALISALYMAAGGIMIQINKQATAITNLGLLLIGAVLANLIGTTGSSMLLIRPYIRLNQGRIRVYHIIFFIFIVSNIGGALTPIGDPPLFLGFLKGVPFFWTLQHNFLPWLLTLCLLSVAFFVIDANHPNDGQSQTITTKKPAVTIIGKRNFIWLCLIIVAVFLDPHILNELPAIQYHGHRFSFIRELTLLSVAWLSYQYASKPALQGNAFSIAPLREVIIIFIGIFGTMVPALRLISSYAQSSTVSAMVTPNTLYWGAGIFSSILDNAPTYLNFLAASMAAQGADMLQSADVHNYAVGGIFAHSILRLKAISIASVFFGAMTYIGNGPNFMVKSIAEQLGIRMPSFFGYFMRFAVPLLLPLLVLIWLIYFYFIYI